MYVESFRQLIVWQKGIELVKEIYNVTNQLPKREVFGLSNQMQRAAISIPSNIAEGKKRRTKIDYVKFLRIADGSAAELETQLIITREIYKNIDLSRPMFLVEEIQKILSVMIRKLETL